MHIDFDWVDIFVHYLIYIIRYWFLNPSKCLICYKWINYFCINSINIFFFCIPKLCINILISRCSRCLMNILILIEIILYTNLFWLSSKSRSSGYINILHMNKCNITRMSFKKLLPNFVQLLCTQFIYRDINPRLILHIYTKSRKYWNILKAISRNNFPL